MTNFFSDEAVKAATRKYEELLWNTNGTLTREDYIRAALEAAIRAQQFMCNKPNCPLLLSTKIESLKDH